MNQPRETGRPPQDEVESERDRRISNIFLLVFFLVMVAAGIWLIDAMLEQKRIDECVGQGRRNCAPIETPTR